MHNFLVSLLFLALFTSCGSDTTPESLFEPVVDNTPDPDSTPVDDNFDVLVWSEEFDGENLNPEFWNFELGDGCPNLCGWGNNEPQIYTDTNHVLQDGFLNIEIRKEGSEYTSTRITTKDKKTLQYGRVEVRAKLPVGTGLWPAIWMLGSNIDFVGWPSCGEIDILEYVGKEPMQVFNSVHTDSSFGNTENTKTTTIADIEEGYHIYELIWTSQKLEFRVDGNITYTYNPGTKNSATWPFDQEFFLIINTAIGGNFGGPTIDDSVLPQTFSIDYVKFYQN